MKKSNPLLLVSNTANSVEMQYICGTCPPECAVLLKKGRNITLLVSEMESNRLNRLVTPGISVINPAQIGIKSGSGFSKWAIELLKSKKINIVDVSPDFPIGIADSLKRAKIKLEIAKTSLCPKREIKNEGEIKAVQMSQRAAVAGMKAAIQQISESKISSSGKLMQGKIALTSERVRATICHTMLDHDCMAQETIVAGGPLSADPHERGEGPLFAGQPIVIDIFPRSGKTGYWGDITRTVCRGPASAELKKQYNAVKAAQAAQLKAVKAGMGADTIHQIGVDLMESRGFKTETIDNVPQGFIHGTGHGVGLEIHEAPRVSSANDKKLRAGHIITIEPGLYYPEIGGVRIEDTIAVTQDGYKMLCPCAKKLEI
jgi:Xaa-Pro aminopeptidase